MISFARHYERKSPYTIISNPHKKIHKVFIIYFHLPMRFRLFNGHEDNGNGRYGLAI